MIDKIEAKLEEHINNILAKETLCHTDYMTLTNELARLVQKEKEAKWDSENQKRTKKLMQSLSELYVC